IFRTFTSGMSATGSYAIGAPVVVRVAPTRELWMVFLSGMGRLVDDHRPHVLAGERPRQLASLQPVDDLHAFDVTRGTPRAEELPVEDELLGEVAEQLTERRLAHEPGIRMPLRILVVEAVLVFDEDDPTHPEDLRVDEDSEVAPVRRQRPLLRRRLPE